MVRWVLWRRPYKYNRGALRRESNKSTKETRSSKQSWVKWGRLRGGETLGGDREAEKCGGKSDGVTREGAGEHSDLAPTSLMCAMIHVHLWVCVPVGVCVWGPAAYLWLVMPWSVASDSPASLWPPVIQNMPLSVWPLHERQRPGRGDLWGSGVTAQINLHKPGDWCMCERIIVCFKTQ